MHRAGAVLPLGMVSVRGGEDVEELLELRVEAVAVLFLDEVVALAGGRRVWA